MTAVGLGDLGLATTGVASARGHPRNFRAHLSGENEVPSVDTDARGQAILRLDSSGTELRYKLVVANIETVLMAHIHNAPAGQNGGIVTWLYPEDGPPPELIAGRIDGVLAEGTITEVKLKSPTGCDSQ